MYLSWIIEIGTSDDITITPQHPYTIALGDATRKVRESGHRGGVKVLQGEIPSAARVSHRVSISSPLSTCIRSVQNGGAHFY